MRKKDVPRLTKEGWQFLHHMNCKGFTDIASSAKQVKLSCWMGCPPGDLIIPVELSSFIWADRQGKGKWRITTLLDHADVIEKDNKKTL